MDALRRRLADDGMWLAIDPPGRPERSIGSVVATGTAGPLRQGFGPVRDHVLGCTVVTGDGRVVRAGGTRGQERRRLRPRPSCRSAASAASASSPSCTCGSARCPRADVTLIARARARPPHQRRRAISPRRGLEPAGARAPLPRHRRGARLDPGRALHRHRRRRRRRGRAAHSHRRPDVAAARRSSAPAPSGTSSARAVLGGARRPSGSACCSRGSMTRSTCCAARSTRDSSPRAPAAPAASAGAARPTPRPLRALRAPRPPTRDSHDPRARTLGHPAAPRTLRRLSRGGRAAGEPPPRDLRPRPAA